MSNFRRKLIWILQVLWHFTSKRLESCNAATLALKMMRKMEVRWLVRWCFWKTSGYLEPKDLMRRQYVYSQKFNDLMRVYHPLAKMTGLRVSRCAPRNIIRSRHSHSNSSQINSPRGLTNSYRFLPKLYQITQSIVYTSKS